ncbi:MAG: preprotein translocase subunit SecA [Deltaproteobacteria bacterium]|nr:preprotein translocase subunit SecA [Deltaproteobacteria bacterium]
MISQPADIPPASHIIRPERVDKASGMLDIISSKIITSVSSSYKLRGRRMKKFLKRVEYYGRGLDNLSEKDLSEKVEMLKQLLHKGGLTEENIAGSFALIRELSFKILGLRHFDTQVTGGRIILDGMVAEMETGEGKTLTATLAAGTAAMAGIPVHVITVNDYLTERDAEWTRPLYTALGLTSGFVIHGMTPEERRNAYSQDIVYCTNKEIVFDYLKDWIILGNRQDRLKLNAEYLYDKDQRIKRLLLRGLHYAIVDEADSVLIDEARTPLIISGQGEGSADEHEFFRQAVDLAQKLNKDTHFTVDKADHIIKLTPEGEEMVNNAAVCLGPLWRGNVRRMEIVRLALSSIYFFKRDEQYMVRDGKIQIIDEFTGRVMPDRSYEKGLHQLIEIKEGCEISNQSVVLARISYQRFFRRYLKLAGMTGTAREVKGELLSVYNLPVVRIPTYKKKIRKSYPDRFSVTEKEKWEDVADRVTDFHEKGRPILVATRSVVASEKVGMILSGRNLRFRILNAKQDREEADIIAEAGREGKITIATNMAGRGVDIKLEEKVKALGGLHVIITERHEAGRIDRQLAGRCARMGDPGSFEAILSLEDTVLEKDRGGFWKMLALYYPLKKSVPWRFFLKKALLSAQKKTEKIHAKMRKNLLKEDERRGNVLSFSGRSE